MRQGGRICPCLQPRTSGLGPRTGVTEGVSLSDLDVVEGVGLRMAGLASRIGGLLDWLAEAVGSDIVLNLEIIRGSNWWDIYLRVLGLGGVLVFW